MKTDKVCVKCGCPISQWALAPLCLWGDRYNQPAYQTPYNQGCYHAWLQWVNNRSLTDLSQIMVSIDQWLETNPKTWLEQS